MTNIIGKKNSNQELSTAEAIVAYASTKGISLKEVHLNPSCESVDEYLAPPSDIDVKGPDFEKYMEERICQLMPHINWRDYLKSTVVNTKPLRFDIVVKYERKDPVFIELNDFYHYKVTSGMNTPEELVRNIVTDYAKRILIKSNGYKFLEVTTMGRSQQDYLEQIYKAL
jgi:hypothetical protein